MLAPLVVPILVAYAIVRGWQLLREFLGGDV